MVAFDLSAGAPAIALLVGVRVGFVDACPGLLSGLFLTMSGRVKGEPE